VTVIDDAEQVTLAVHVSVDAEDAHADGEVTGLNVTGISVTVFESDIIDL